MSKIRIYLPSTFSRLRAMVQSGVVGEPPLSGHAVTDALRATYPDGNEEEWEYAAMNAAAQESVALLTDADPPRRVVLAVDAEVAEGEDDEPSAVEVRGPLPARAVAAVHVDDAGAEATVLRARQTHDADGDAAVEALDACLDHELGWYAVQEIDGLLEELPAPPP